MKKFLLLLLLSSCHPLIAHCATLHLEPAEKYQEEVKAPYTAPDNPESDWSRWCQNSTAVPPVCVDAAESYSNSLYECEALRHKCEFETEDYEYLAPSDGESGYGTILCSMSVSVCRMVCWKKDLSDSQIGSIEKEIERYEGVLQDIAVKHVYD